MIPSPRAVRVLAVLALLAAALGILWISLTVPPEKALGESIRILFVHVGAATMCYVVYGLTALGAVMYLWRREARWDRLAEATAELGLVFTTLTLLTGSIWMKVAQGMWWTWDARLTLTMILWFIYVGYLLLRQYTVGEARAALSAVLALIALPLLVLNHFAVSLFRTAHPQSIFYREGGAAASPEYLTALLLSLVIYGLVFAALLAARLRVAPVPAER